MDNEPILTENRKHFPFIILTVSVMILLVVPVLIQDGMFMDGLLYSCISKNLANGKGSFWFPHFSPTLHPFFDQQPPLGFGIQSLFYRIFGSSIYVERFYSFLMLVLGGLLIAILWRYYFKESKSDRIFYWLPVIMWITIPVCFWAYSNNLLECTMVIFDLIAILFILFFLNGKGWSYLIAAGIFIFLASLTKGFQGLFPLAVIFFHRLVFRRYSFSKMLWHSLVLTVIPLLIYFVLFQSDRIRLSLSTYLNNRVFNSIANVSNVSSRFHLLGRLAMELLPLILFVLLLMLLFRKKIMLFQKNFSHFIFFILIGISASFPLIVTREQRGFYLVTSLPFYAVAIAIIAMPYISALINKIKYPSGLYRAMLTVSVLLLIAAIFISASKLGKTYRDKDMLHDVYLIGKEIPVGTIAGTTPQLWRVWSLQEYFIRHYDIALEGEKVHQRRIVISDQNPETGCYKKVDIPTFRYHLFLRKK